MNLDAAELRERVREALPLEGVMRGDGVVLKRSGTSRWVCCCPFHEEHSPSFVVGGRALDRGHCFGCGWDGDIYDYWEERRHVEFRQSLVELADMAGIFVPEGLRNGEWKPSKAAPVRSPERVIQTEGVKPPLPPLRCLRASECGELARVRGLDVDAVRVAAFEFKRVAASQWPLYRAAGIAGHGGETPPLLDRGDLEAEWLPRSQGCWPSWCVIDETRNVAEFRRLDGEMYPRVDGSGIKAWSTAGKNWPIGAGSMGDRCGVLLVEGGPDLLAGYHFLRRFGMLSRVAVVCMLGAANRMRPESLPAFKGRRVRIMMDADSVRGDGKAPGLEAAARWQGQLTEAGAAVETFSLYGLTRADGEPVKDLNDLARCPEAVTEAAEIREAFTVWDF